MRHLVFVFVALCAIGFKAKANPHSEKIKSTLEAQTSCDRFVRFDSEYLFTGIPRSEGNVGGVRMTSLSDPKSSMDIVPEMMAVDVIRMGNTLWVLTQNSIEEWDITRHERVGRYPTTQNPQRPFQQKESPMSMAAHGTQFIIAHGRIGMTVFDTRTKTVTHQKALITHEDTRESMAVGVVVVGDMAYMAYDNFTISGSYQEPAFRGIVTVDLNSMMSVLALNGMDPGSTSIMSYGDKIFVNFGGHPIVKYRMDKLSGKKMPRAAARTWRYAVKGHPVGTGAIDDKYFYTCFWRGPDQPTDRTYVMPMAIERASVGMN